ncbi:MAG: hypothetical protein NT099_06285 [Candidatus Saganbacteria bacterium]|nr:hypothetical protein [Candidatus Saganbacteria bacterium]
MARKVLKLTQKALEFWKDKIKSGNRVLRGRDFPGEYVRKLLQKEGLLFPILRGLYLLKNKGEEDETLFYRWYWLMIEKIMGQYGEWSIEKESALALYLGRETIPQRIKVRISRNVKYVQLLPFGLELQIRPDPSFEEKTRREWKIEGTMVYVDIPEKVLFGLHKRNGVDFKAFIKGMKFDRRFLEVLYADAPKPVVAQELIKFASEAGEAELALVLRKIVKENTIYRL